MRSLPLLRGVALAAASLVLVGSFGCDDTVCEDERLTVDENGTCSATPQRFEIESSLCRLTVNALFANTGLPERGTIGPEHAPVRRGGFLLYRDGPPFRLCNARRVDYRLELSCEDDQGAPVCEATLTERP